MIKMQHLKVGRNNPVKIRPPDTFTAFIEQNAIKSLDIHFGANYDVLVVVPNGKNLSKDNLERIRILTEVK